MEVRTLRECLLLLAGLIVGLYVALFLKQNQCYLTYKKHFLPRAMPNEVQFNKSQFIFVGVMTAETFLQTRAQAVFNTWGKNVAGKLTFFSSQTHKSSKLPLVSLPDVDDSYPPLKKSLMMVKYMHDHHIDDFEWFMRADDDVYIRNDKLVRLLRSLNSSEDIYLGQAGTGAKKERGMLNLLPGDNYCMGGPGAVFSRSVLRKVAPHVQHCLLQAPKSHMHEDTELGRCIQRYVGISCTWAYEMRKLFLHDYDASGKLFLGGLDTKTINDAITLHPIKDPAYMYRMHVHFNNERIQDLQQQGVKLQHVLRNMDRLLQANRLSFHEKRGFQDGRDLYHQLAINNSEKWEMFTSTSFFPEIGLKAPYTKIRGGMKTEVDNILEKIKEFVNKEFWKNPDLGKLKQQELDYGYRRFHPLYGIQQVVQVTVSSMKKQGSQTAGEKETFQHISQKRRFYTQQPFANFRYTTVPLPRMPPIVHFIVPLEGRLETFRRFMKNFELVCLKVLQRVKLVVAYSSSVSSPHEHKVIMKEYREKYPEAELIWLNVAGTFSRGIALSLAANKFDKTALLFLCDVDLIFNSEFIDRCRLNTELGKRVYFPIMYSQFDPELTYNNQTKPDSHFTINKDAGVWRTFSYGPACIYHQDMDAVGGFDTSIKGWGLEDVDLFEKFVAHPEIDVLRAADPGLIHVYHKINCDPNLSVIQHTQCQGSKASILASQKTLVRTLLSTQNAHD